MIYLHMDKHYRPDQWYRRFEYLLDQKGIARKNIDLTRKDFRRLRPQPRDGLIGRFGHEERELRRIRPIFPELADRFNGQIFPGVTAYHYYDNKQRQIELFETHEFPAPLGAPVTTPADVERFLQRSGLTFPLVSKRLYGASSSGVRLARKIDEVFLPGIVQEFCRDNDGDYRIVVIGNRVMGFFRRNRPGDFRASGSGLIEYVEELDPACVQLAFEISHRMGFDSMAYDFVRDNQGRWVVLECSYVYVDASVRDCQYYYEMPAGKRCPKPDIYPEDFILEDFLAKYPNVTAGGRGPSFWMRTAHWLTARPLPNHAISKSHEIKTSRAA